MQVGRVFGRTMMAVGVVCGGAALAAAQTGPLYRVTVLDSLPGTTSCYGAALNDAGVVAGSCVGPSGNYSDSMAVVWHAGVPSSLGRLPAGHYSWGTAINSLGTVVGDGDTGDFRPEGFITTAAGLLDYDPIGGGNIRSIGITDGGVIFGNMTKSLSGNTSSWNVMMWTQDPGHPDRYRETVLPKLHGTDKRFDGVYALASNKLGQVVGWVTTDVIGQMGGFWNNDAAHTVVALPRLPGAWNSSIAEAVNDLGQAAGYGPTADNHMHAVVWANDAAHSVSDLGTLPGDDQSAASGINTAGQVIGVSSLGFPATSVRAFVYREGTMYDLAAQVDPADGTWAISQAIAINNAGQIVAYATRDGVVSPIVLTPAVQ